MSDRFIGREAELAVLDRAYRGRGAQLVLVYGRRRIGKSFLLQQFSRGHKVVFYQATRQTQAAELQAFTAEVRAALGFEGLPPGYVFPAWEDALAFIAERSDRRVVVVIDEFP